MFTGAENESATAKAAAYRLASLFACPSGKRLRGAEYFTFIAEKLEAMGIEVHRDIGKTGVVGMTKCGDGKGVIAIRADIDAIQLTEQGDWSYRLHDRRADARLRT